MIKLQFKQSINASAQNVYETMLGLKDKRTYEYWVSVFNPTSTYEGNWEKGSTINFVGFDEFGKKGGLVATIVEHQPAEFISIKQLGMWADPLNTSNSQSIEKLAGAHENYTFENNNGNTTVIVDLETLEEYLEFFQGTYPIALEKLKDISERELA